MYNSTLLVEQSILKDNKLRFTNQLMTTHENEYNLNSVKMMSNV